MKSLVSRDELRRLEKAAREKDKAKLRDWAIQYEKSISSYIQDGYEKIYQRELANGFDILMLAVIYTLFNDDYIKIDADKIELFLDNFYKTIDGYRSGEYKPSDYLDKLEKAGIVLSDYNYNQRITDIVVFVLSDEYMDKRDIIIEKFKEQQVIFLELDNINNKENESQIRKNVDMINMCTRFYYLGDSETIQIYKQYAQQINKPVIESLFILNDLVKEGE